MFDTAVVVYKGRTEQVPIRTSVMFQNFEVNHCFNTRLATAGGYTLPRCAENFGQRRIIYEGMKLWSTLPNEIQEAQSVEVFKQKVKDYMFEIFCKVHNGLFSSFLFNYLTSPSIFFGF